MNSSNKENIKALIAVLCVLLIAAFVLVFMYSLIHPNAVRKHCDNTNRVYANKVGEFRVVKNDTYCTKVYNRPKPTSTSTPTVKPSTTAPVSQPPTDPPPVDPPPVDPPPVDPPPALPPGHNS